MPENLSSETVNYQEITQEEGQLLLQLLIIQEIVEGLEDSDGQRVMSAARGAQAVFQLESSEEITDALLDRSFEEIPFDTEKALDYIMITRSQTFIRGILIHPRWRWRESGALIATRRTPDGGSTLIKALKALHNERDLMRELSDEEKEDLRPLFPTEEDIPDQLEKLTEEEEELFLKCIQDIRLAYFAHFGIDVLTLEESE